MERQEVLEKVQEIVAKEVHRSPTAILENMSFEEVGVADSLATTEILMEIEEQFPAIGEIPEDVAQTIKTVGDIVDYICEHQP